MPDASDSGCPELPPYCLRMETAQNGEPAPVLEMGGERFYMASRYDPSRESERWAAGLDVKDGDLVVLVGGGARAAQALLNTGHVILLAYFEPFPELSPNSQPADGRLRCFTRAPDLVSFLREVGVEGMIQYRFIPHPSLKRPLEKYLRALSGAARAAFEERIAAVMTLSDIGRLVAGNILANLAALSAMRPVRALFSAWEGEVVCVAGSGPSLDRSAPEIARRQAGVGDAGTWGAGGADPDRLRVIAVDSAVLPLLEYGVRVDVGVCLDPRLDTAEHLAGLGGSSRSPGQWAVSAAIHPQVLRRLPADRLCVFVGDHPLERWLCEQWGDPGSLAGGGSVILPAFDLACRAGASEIILAGADFSMGPGRVSHSRQSAKVRRALLSASRLDTVEDWTYAEAEERAPRLEIAGGRRLRTGENLLAYRRQLERLVAGYRGRCRQLCPALGLGGVEGVEDLSGLAGVPIYNMEGTLAPAGVWSTPAGYEAVRRELLGRLSSGVEADPLFRIAVESAAFTRARKTRQAPKDILSDTAREVADELRRALGA